MEKLACDFEYSSIFLPKNSFDEPILFYVLILPENDIPLFILLCTMK
jgi:hypothetical protein